MPLSKKRDAARRRLERAAKKVAGTALMPQAMVRKLRRLGVNPTRYLTAAPVSLDGYRDLERRLEAKIARVEWQSSGIQKLQGEVAAHSERIMQLEGDLARLEALCDTLIREEA